MQKQYFRETSNLRFKFKKYEYYFFVLNDFYKISFNTTIEKLFKKKVRILSLSGFKLGFILGDNTTKFQN